MTDGKSRNVYIDNVKALLIILVVVGHFTDLAVDESEMMKSLFVFIYSFHMPLFIFVNGLLCKHIVKDRHRVMDKVAVFTQSRFRRKPAAQRFPFPEALLSADRQSYMQKQAPPLTK